MDHKPQPLITNTRGRAGRSSHPRSLIGRRDLIKLTAGAGVAAVGVAGRGLILPWVHTSRAAARRVHGGAVPACMAGSRWLSQRSN